MSWPKASKEKEELLRGLVEDLECEGRRMFGAPVFFSHGNMFAGVFADDIFLRLDDGDRIRFLAEQKGSKTFEPIEGRRMREYVIVPPDLLRDRTRMKEWLSRSFDYASRLKKGPASKRSR